MEQKATSETHQTATLYFASRNAADRDSLLFYEERLLEDSTAEDRTNSLWTRLKSKFDQYSFEAFAGDRFVRRLRRIRNIRVLLGRPIDPHVVQARIGAMLRDRKYHHLRWLVIDSALLPVSLLIAPLPGPNLIGYYLLLRVYMHWKSYRAASRAKLEHLDVQISSQAEEMNAVLEKTKDVRAALKELRKRYGFRALQENQFVPRSENLKVVWNKIYRRNAAPSK